MRPTGGGGGGGGVLRRRERRPALATPSKRWHRSQLRQLNLAISWHLQHGGLQHLQQGAGLAAQLHITALGSSAATLFGPLAIAEPLMGCGLQQAHLGAQLHGYRQLGSHRFQQLQHLAVFAAAQRALRGLDRLVHGLSPVGGFPTPSCRFLSW